MIEEPQVSLIEGDCRAYVLEGEELRGIDGVRRKAVLMVTRGGETSPRRAQVSVRDFLREKREYQLKGITEEAPSYTWSMMIGLMWLIVFTFVQPKRSTMASKIIK